VTLAEPARAQPVAPLPSGGSRCAGKNLLIAVMVVSGAARAEPPLPLCSRSLRRHTEQAMQMHGLSPGFRPPVLPFDAAVSRALQQPALATVAMEEVARARAIVEQVRSASCRRAARQRQLPAARSRAAQRQRDSPADQINANLLLAAPLIAPSAMGAVTPRTTSRSRA
jgi:hypothetical protein